MVKLIVFLILSGGQPAMYESGIMPLSECWPLLSEAPTVIRKKGATPVVAGCIKIENIERQNNVQT